MTRRAGQRGIKNDLVRAGRNKTRQVQSLATSHRCFDLPPKFPPRISRVLPLVKCTPSLDRRKLEFLGFLMPAGWLRR